MNRHILNIVFCLMIVAAVRAENLQATCARIVKENDATTIAGKDGWFFSKNELKHIAAGKFWGEEAEKTNAGLKEGQRDPLKAIVDFKERLAEEGIDLIFVPVPAKVTVYPDKLSKELPAPVKRQDKFDQEFYAALKDKGVKVIDATDRLIAARDKEQVFCKTDTHFSPSGARIVAKAIAAELDINGDAVFKTEESILSAKGDLIDGKEDAAPEKMKIMYVRDDKGNLIPDENPESPVLLLTDSHGLIFHMGGDMLATGGGLADLLAVELGMPVDLMGKMGSAATPVRVDLYRKARKNPEWLAKKKTIVWVLTVREFTGSNWSTKIPVRPGK